jgi:hypothetical protein
MLISARITRQGRPPPSLRLRTRAGNRIVTDGPRQPERAQLSQRIHDGLEKRPALIDVGRRGAADDSSLANVKTTMNASLWSSVRSAGNGGAPHAARPAADRRPHPQRNTVARRVPPIERHSAASSISSSWRKSLRRAIRRAPIGGAAPLLTGQIDIAGLLHVGRPRPGGGGGPDRDHRADAALVRCLCAWRA